jgi:hypothetical protein
MNSRLDRHSVRIPCSVVRERDFRLVADSIQNLSPDGMLTGPAAPVLTGEKLIVSFRAPRWGIWVDTEATVARVVHARRAGDRHRALGIEFENLSPFSRWLLKHTLRFVPTPPPGKRRASA